MLTSSDSIGGLCGGSEPQVSGEALQAVADLQHEFACGGQASACVASGADALDDEALRQRQAERGGLAGCRFAERQASPGHRAGPGWCYPRSASPWGSGAPSVRASARHHALRSAPQSDPIGSTISSAFPRGYVQPEGVTIQSQSHSGMSSKNPIISIR